MRWYVGQRVVCIKTHPDKVVTKGLYYIIKGIKQSCCGGGLVLDVGIKDFDDSADFCRCADCGKLSRYDAVWWLCESRFAPIDELSDYTVETLLNEIEEPVKVKV